MNLFLAAKLEAKESGLISPRTYNDYLHTGKLCLDQFGRQTPVDRLKPTDFAAFKSKMIEDGRGIVSVGNQINRTRVIFKWLIDNDLIDQPVKFGPEFRRPTAKQLRRHRRSSVKKLFTAEQINLLLNECGIQMRAMVLLGINCGFGNNDCATLPISAVDLDDAWIEYPRPKTEVDRSCPLWPETVEAMRQAEMIRPGPDEDASGRFFVMPSGRPWDMSTEPISKQTRGNLLRAGIKAGGFYWLRHTFQTIADGAKDPVAVKHIMGHLDASMSATYREGIDRQRLIEVTDHVRHWLWPELSPDHAGQQAHTGASPGSQTGSSS